MKITGKIVLLTLMSALLVFVSPAGVNRAKAADVWDTAKSMSLLLSETISVSGSEDFKYYKYTAEQTGYYNISSSKGTGVPKIIIYDEKKEVVYETYKYSTNTSYSYNLYLTKGQTYYFSFGVNTDSAGLYSVILKSVNFESISSWNCYEDEVYYEGHQDKSPEKDFTYDVNSGVITMNNFHGYYLSVECDVVNTLPPLEIKINGTNTFTGSYYGPSNCLIRTKGFDVKLTGDGTLEFNGYIPQEDHHQGGIDVTGNLTIDGPTLKVCSGSGGYVIDVASIYTDNGGCFYLKSGVIYADIYPVIEEKDDGSFTASYREFISLRKQCVFQGGVVRVQYHYGGELENLPEGTTVTVKAPDSFMRSYTGAISSEGAQVIVLADKELSEIPVVGVYNESGKWETSTPENMLSGAVIDISKVVMSLEQNSFEADGTEKKPKVIAEGLVLGTDFTVSYENNVKAGTAKVIVKGTGDFTGTKTLTFQIVEKKSESKGSGGSSASGLIIHKKGAKFTKGGYRYKITKAANKFGKNGTVSVTGAVKKTGKSVTIAATVKYDGVVYKVTSVGARAFKKYKKLKKATIGKHITSIGKQAFYGDKKLKKITVKSAKIKKIAAKSFKGIHKKATIKVPKKKKKTYKKMLKKAGAKWQKLI